MKRTLFTILLAILAGTSIADEADDLTVTHVRYHLDWGSSTGIVTVGVDNVPSGINVHTSNSNICFAFDATTDAGKSLLSLVLTANVTGDKVHVWYDANTDGGNTVSSLSTIQILELK